MTAMTDEFEIFLMRSWTHHEPKKLKGAPGLRSAGFKPPAGSAAVMLHLGNVPVDQDVTDEWIERRLADAGLARVEKATEEVPGVRT